MHDLNIEENEAAMAILQRAHDDLKSLGVYCRLVSLSLPQGTAVSLHVGATAKEASASEEAAHAGVDELAPWEHIGMVAVDSAQLMLVDPCYIDSHWERSPFEDKRVYRNRQTGDTLQYKVDFADYKTVIPSYGKTMNELNRTGDWEQMTVPVPPGLSYNAVCRTTNNQDGAEVAGLAVAFRTGYGDGHYPVFVSRNEDGRVMQVLVDFAESEDEVIELGIVSPHN